MFNRKDGPSYGGADAVPCHGADHGKWSVG